MNTLKKGSTGTNVITLQKALNAAGFPVTADGIFGGLTEHAVTGFQAKMGLTQDGIVGSQTWAALGVQDTTYLMGVDVSHYEVGFDFVKGKKDGLVFMMTKASEGLGVDTTCVAEVTNARAAGIVYDGVYHFHHANVSTVSQVSVFMKQYKAANPNMPPILDLEETSVNGQSVATVNSTALAVLQGMEEASGKVPMIYIDMNMINILGINSDARFNKYPRWVARYSSSEPTVAWTFWQYTDKGEQGADTDWFHGNEVDLAKFCGVTA